VPARTPDALVELVLDALDDLKGINPVTLDVRELSNVMDYLVVCSGSSNRHVKSLAENVVRKAKESGQRPLGVEGEDGGEWVLVDLGDVVVHVMLPATRDFYDLERLWMAPPAAGVDKPHEDTDHKQD
jgi:ribosome-associated protein